jgi:hypothetical protein
MRFLVAFLLYLCAVPAMAYELQPTADNVKPDCCGCGSCWCDQECLCPEYVTHANGKRTILLPVNPHPIASGVKQTVAWPFRWLVAPPKKLWAQVPVR